MPAILRRGKVSSADGKKMDMLLQTAVYQINRGRIYAAHVFIKYETL